MAEYCSRFIMSILLHEFMKLKFPFSFERNCLFEDQFMRTESEIQWETGLPELTYTRTQCPLSAQRPIGFIIWEKTVVIEWCSHLRLICFSPAGKLAKWAQPPQQPSHSVLSVVSQTCLIAFEHFPGFLFVRKNLVRNKKGEWGRASDVVGFLVFLK